MKTIVALVVVVLGVGVSAWAGDQPVPKIPPPDFTVKVDAPPGTSDQDIAAGIAVENAKREPAAQEAARVAKQRATADEAHAQRRSKVCDNIPEKAMADDPSLRRMCQ